MSTEKCPHCGSAITDLWDYTWTSEEDDQIEINCAACGHPIIIKRAYEIFLPEPKDASDMNDFLRARVLFLENALKEAARSLDTASEWRKGENDIEDIWPWLRSRAGVARQALTMAYEERRQVAREAAQSPEGKKLTEAFVEALNPPGPSAVTEEFFSGYNAGRNGSAAYDVQTAWATYLKYGGMNQPEATWCDVCKDGRTSLCKRIPSCNHEQRMRRHQADERAKMAAALLPLTATPACGHPPEAWQHIDLNEGLSCRRLATWCKQCGALNTGTWKTPTKSLTLNDAYPTRAGEPAGPLDALQIITRDRDVWKQRAAQAELAAKDPVVWANEATPFTGSQVAELLAENEKYTRIMSLLVQRVGGQVCWTAHDLARAGRFQLRWNDNGHMTTLTTVTDT